MENLLNSMLTSSTAEITPASALITILAAFAFGGIVAATYYKTQDAATYQRSLAVTLFMLPVILAVIILFVGSNIARAFSMAGTLSIIRFRSAPGDAKDIGFIFFDVAAGLACGIGLFGYGALFVLILCAALIIAEKIKLFKPRAEQKTLSITIPEDLNRHGAFDDILRRYTEQYSLSKIKTTDLGSLFQLIYSVSLLPEADEQELLNELRTRNGNLTIMISDVPQIVK